MHRIFLFFLFALPTNLSAQSSLIRQLEIESHQATGAQKVEKLILLSDMFQQEGFTSEAAEKARDAVQLAHRLQSDDLIARASLQLAEAILATRRKGYLRQAETVLKESTRSQGTETSTELRIQTLSLLEQIATQQGNMREANLLRKRIAELKGELTPQEKADEKTGLFGRLSKAKERKEIIDDRLDSLTRKAAESETLREQQQHLASAFAAQENRISQMSADQMRTELLLAQQERLLDSMQFRNLLDSIQLEGQSSKIHEQEMEIREKYVQIELQESQRNLLLTLAGLVLLVAVGLWLRYTNIRKFNHVLQEKNNLILSEKQRSEELLLNILPKAIAEELKSKGSALARQYPLVTVLFTDFKDFSKIAGHLPAQQLVDDLDYCYRRFDRIIGLHGLEKIKTIGDSYMCAGGLPIADHSHPVQVVRAALEIQQFLSEWKKEKIQCGQPFFEARIGIHSGPIVAGVVGERKYAYDIWGDTVNLASRMESNSEPGRINISATTFELVCEAYECEPRGKISAKNIGEVEMYFVKRERTDFN